MELEQHAAQFRRQGLGVVAITYDAGEVVADFAQRRNITYPLLADPHSEIIRAFGVLNTAVPRDHLWYGVPYPGTFIVDQNGVVRAKYFEDHYSTRYSAPTILLREFGSVTGTRETAVRTDYLTLQYYATRDVVHPALRITLVADFRLPPQMHVYAPGVENYIPIEWTLEPSSFYSAHPVEYPQSEVLYLPAIEERVPVYQGEFRITQDVTIGSNSALEAILTGDHQLKIKGKLRYQACDDKICYLPQVLPLEWVLQVQPLDRDRVPEPLQRKAGVTPQR